MSNPSISRIAGYVRFTNPKLKDYRPSEPSSPEAATAVAFLVMVSPTMLLIHQYLQWTLTGLLCLPFIFFYVLKIWASAGIFVNPEKAILDYARLQDLYTDHQRDIIRNLIQAGMFYLFVTLGIIISSEISLGNEDLILRVSMAIAGAVLTSIVLTKIRYNLCLRKYRRDLETK